MKKHIVVAGGGSAGWIAASLLQHHFSDTNTKITLIESDDVPVIGVGEGSTPHLKQLFLTLGIAEEHWMSYCHATYKNGIRFEGWNSDSAPGYFHPFPSGPDKHSATAFLQACEKRRQGSPLTCLPDGYFLSNWLTEHRKSPVQRKEAPSVPLNYAYHFDAARLASLLKQHTIKQGLKHITGTISKVTRYPDGNLAALILDNGQRINGDFFIDCTGFRSLLLQKTLNVGFVSYADALFNDSAVAVSTLGQHDPLPATRSTAMDNGWRWTIPLTHRTGNGYVYSSEFESTDSAAMRLADSVSVKCEQEHIRHIPMRVGRTEVSWAQNCLAVGLSQGFIEPLEATALHLVQETVEQFLSAWSADNYSSRHRDQFNRLIANRFDGIRDYIVAHYCLSRRQGPYWEAVRNDAKRSDTLTALLQTWRNGGSIIQFIQENQIGQYYSPVSWYCLLSGYDVFAPTNSVPKEDPYLAQVQSMIAKWGATFIPHKEVLRLLRHDSVSSNI